MAVDGAVDLLRAQASRGEYNRGARRNDHLVHEASTS
jgi:hypothetical protein